MQNNFIAETFTQKNVQHIVWLDLVRFIAMFLVIACHCCDPFNCTPNATPEYRFWGAIFGSSLRPCVPLFVMITGFLLLPVKEEMTVFYKKRILRVLFPFLIWSVIYCLFPWIVGILGYGADVVSIFFPYSTWGNVVPAQDLTSSLKNIAMIPLNFSSFSVHMWYAYLLIGIYLFMPIFSAWFTQSGKKAQYVFLSIWAISLFIPYFREFGSQNLFGSCSWNEFGLFYYFAGFTGYLLLGAVLGKMKDLSWGATLALSLPFLCIGYVITFVGFRTMFVDQATDAQIELFWTYCSPNVVFMTVPLFLIIKKIKISSVPCQKLLFHFSVCSFGIYMTHYFFIGPSFLIAKALPVYLIIPVSAVIGIIFVWIFVAIAQKVLPKNIFKVCFG